MVTKNGNGDTEQKKYYEVLLIINCRAFSIIFRCFLVIRLYRFVQHHRHIDWLVWFSPTSREKSPTASEGEAKFEKSKDENVESQPKESSKTENKMVESQRSKTLELQK